MRSVRSLVLVAIVALLAVATACSGDAGSGTGAPQIVVTTSPLGDVVEQMVGGEATVTVLMPPGADPHDVSLSAQQTNQVRQADALVTNGAGFEAGMSDALDAAAADGVATVAAIDAVDALPLAGGDRVDPHFFTDPDRMAAAATGIASFLRVEVPALDTEAFGQRAAAEVADLRALAVEVDRILAPIPSERRVLVTNHDVFAYLADRYGFEVVGTVIPGGRTGGEADARALAGLAEVIEEAGVPAIFADSSSPETLSDALAAEAGDVEVVDLYTESLGPEGSDGATYDAMVRTNATRIAAALA